MKKFFMVAMIGLGAVGFGFAACGGGTVCEDIPTCGATASEGEGEGEVPEGFCEEGTDEYTYASCAVDNEEAYCESISGADRDAEKAAPYDCCACTVTDTCDLNPECDSE